MGVGGVGLVWRGGAGALGTGAGQLPSCRAKGPSVTREGRWLAPTGPVPGVALAAYSPRGRLRVERRGLRGPWRQPHSLRQAAPPQDEAGGGGGGVLSRLLPGFRGQLSGPTSGRGNRPPRAVRPLRPKCPRHRRRLSRSCFHFAGGGRACCPVRLRKGAGQGRGARAGGHSAGAAGVSRLCHRLRLPPEARWLPVSVRLTWARTPGLRVTLAGLRDLREAQRADEPGPPVSPGVLARPCARGGGGAGQLQEVWRPVPNRHLSAPPDPAAGPSPPRRPERPLWVRSGAGGEGGGPLPGSVLPRAAAHRQPGHEGAGGRRPAARLGTPVRAHGAPSPAPSVAWEPAGDGSRVLSLADNHILLWDLRGSSRQAVVSTEARLPRGRPPGWTSAEVRVHSLTHVWLELRR